MTGSADFHSQVHSIITKVTQSIAPKKAPSADSFGQVLQGTKQDFKKTCSEGEKAMLQAADGKAGPETAVKIAHMKTAVETMTVLIKEIRSALSSVLQTPV